MARKISKIKQSRFFLEYLLVKFVVSLTKASSHGRILWLGARLGDIAYYGIPFRRKMVRQNLARAFPEKTKKEINKITRGVYRNLAQTALEQLSLAGMSRENLLKIVSLEGEEHIREATLQKKGVLFVGGHLGNWEYAAMAISAAGYPLSAVTADINNIFLDKLIKSNRTKFGAVLLPKKGSRTKILNTLKDNGNLLLAMDQDARKRGLFVDFFGRPASTPKGPAKLALAYGVSLLFFRPLRNHDGTITVVIEKIETDHLTGTEEEKLLALTQFCTHKIEECIRSTPDQWLWLHRRWKTRPPLKDTK